MNGAGVLGESRPAGQERKKEKKSRAETGDAAKRLVSHMENPRRCARSRVTGPQGPGWIDLREAELGPQERAGGARAERERAGSTSPVARAVVTASRTSVGDGAALTSGTGGAGRVSLQWHTAHCAASNAVVWVCSTPWVAARTNTTTKPSPPRNVRPVGPADMRCLRMFMAPAPPNLHKLPESELYTAQSGAGSPPQPKYRKRFFRISPRTRSPPPGRSC